MPHDWAPTIEPHEAAIQLHSWGYFHEGAAGEQAEAAKQHDWTGKELKVAIADFQTMYRPELEYRAGRLALHWEPTGELDAVTEALVVKPRCGLPDVGQARAAYGPLEANWPDACRDDITFAPLFSALAPLSGADTLGALEDACKSWTLELQILLRLQADLGKQARIWADAERLGGSTLAWSYLAQNSCAVHLQQRYNLSINWTRRYLQGVSAHELGHALGLQHDRDPAALMYPYARPELYLPAEPDIRQALTLGYAKRAGGPPPPPPSAGIARLVAELTDGRRLVFVPAAGTGGGHDWS